MTPEAEAAVRFDQRVLDAALRTRHVGRRLEYRRRTTSTMDDARRLAEGGAPHGLVVLAEEQTAGRGTHGRRWVSPAGQNLYFTILVRPSAGALPRLSMITPLAVANAVEQITGLFPRIKWPNDLHLRGRKFAGILIEAEWEAASPQYALVGVGINVNFDPAPHQSAIDRPATSLMLERGHPLPREPLLAAALNAFERAYRAWRSPHVYAGWRRRLETLGRSVTVSAPGREPVDGVAEDVSEDGALIVVAAGGGRHVFHAGEVTLRPVPPPVPSPEPPAAG